MNLQFFKSAPDLSNHGTTIESNFKKHPSLSLTTLKQKGKTYALQRYCHHRLRHPEPGTQPSAQRRVSGPGPSLFYNPRASRNPKRGGKTACGQNPESPGNNRQNPCGIRGKFCYVNTAEPTRTIDTIIQEQGGNIARINATHCMDMLADKEEREQLAQEQKVLWMTPGWIKFRHYVYKGWDKGLANENFPKHTGGAMVLDGIGFMDQYMAEKPEELLEYSDWMGIAILPCPVTLDRLKALLTEQAEQLAGQ